MAWTELSFDPESVASNSDVASSAMDLAASASDAASSASVAAGLAIPKTLIAAAGDLIYGSANDTPAILSKGSDGEVLTLSSGLPSWAARGIVDRGDPSAADYTLGDFTTDFTWNDLDLSGIVPAGATFVVISGNINDNAVGSSLQFRKNGNSNNFNSGSVRTQVASATIDFRLIIACDSNRVIEYRASNLTFTTINVTVVGWVLG